MDIPPDDTAAVTHRVAVYGAGYWAKNGMRVVAEAPGCDLAVVCDLDPGALDWVRRRFPGTDTTTDPADPLRDTGVDLVYIATPPGTHFDLARRALYADCHVLVEKPYTVTTQEAEQLNRLAVERGRTVMVGHTFLYAPPVLKVKELIDDGSIGEVLYIDSQRVNLGRYQDSGVLWDLAPHDLSILFYWLGTEPDRVSATGRSLRSGGREDVVFVTLEFPNGTLAQLHLSWLAPTKLRRTTVSGSQRMVVYDDTQGAESVRVYDLGVDVQATPDGFGESQLSYRRGDSLIPYLDNREPLRAEWEHFVECVETGRLPRSSMQQGLATVRTIEAIEEALGAGRRIDVPRAAVPQTTRSSGPSVASMRTA